MSARLKTAAAAEPAELGARILHHCAGATSKQPARADDVAALVRGARAEFCAALEQLVASSQIATARIQRQGDPAPWLAIWPTGVTARGAMWTSRSHNTLFGHKHLPARLPQRPDPTRDPRPDLGRASRAANQPAKETAMPTSETTNRLREQAARMIAGRAQAEAVPVKLIAQACGISQRGAIGVCEALEKRGLAKRIVVGVGNARCAKAYDPRVAANDTPAARPAAPLQDHAALAAEVGRGLAQAIGMAPATATPTTQQHADAASPAARPAAKPSADEPRKRGELRGAVWSLIKGVPDAAGLSLAELGSALAIGGAEPSHAALSHVLNLLQGEGLARPSARQRPVGFAGPRLITVWYDATTDAAPPAARVADIDAAMSARDMLTDLPPDNDPAEPVRFCLFDNGELLVRAGSLFVAVPPAATRRLAALLGVGGGAA